MTSRINRRKFLAASTATAFAAPMFARTARPAEKLNVAVAFVDPLFVGSSNTENDEHPTANIQVGEEFASRVINAVLSSPPSKAEVGRLRESVVVGMPMPPSTHPTSLFMDEEHFLAMSNWILQGAPFGHGPLHLAWPYGRQARLEGGRLTF